jgi:hypothetical protein
MDQAAQRQHLAQAEEHIAQGDRHIARQRDLIAQFELRGHDTTMACTLLVQFEELQAIHVATHARLLRERGIVLI